MNNSASVEAAERYRTLSSRFTGLVEAVPVDCWDAPSPCAEWSARDVFAHVVNTERDLLCRMPFPPPPTTDGLEVRSAWSIIRDRVQQALDNPHEAGHNYNSMFGPTTFAQTIADTMRQPGVFGPEVEVPSDADPQSKLLGLLGRRP